MLIDESGTWERRVRALFWLLGLFTGGMLAYTTRFYLNADGINYIEMGDSLRDGAWSGLVNTTESPGYAFALGLGHMLLNTTVLDELPLLKAVNLVCFALAMAACDLFVTGLRPDVERLGNVRGMPLAFPALSALTYAAFLYLAFGWVRIRLVAPDMLVFAFLLVCMWFILRIRRDPDSFANFLGLGLFTGLCYLCKTFFFLFSAFIFALAALVSGSLRKSIPRVLVSALVMLVVATPLLVGLSREVGQFSYGEVGNFGYVYNLAGTGEPVHRPDRLNVKPLVQLFRSGPGKTFPSGYDLAYWTLGMKPSFNAAIHWKLLVENVLEMLSFAYGLIMATLVWLLVQWRIARLDWGGWWPPSLFGVLVFLSVPGIGIYCIMHVEPRYLVGFFLFLFVAVTLVPRYGPNDARTRTRALVSAGTLTLFLLAGVAETAVDQSVRGLRSQGNKTSHKDAFLEFRAVNEFLESKGIKKGEEVAIVGTDHLPPTYWARMSGIRITGSIPNENEFIVCDRHDRERALESLRDHGVKAVVAKGTYVAKLVEEGWQLIPGTRDYYVVVLR